MAQTFSVSGQGPVFSDVVKPKDLFNFFSRRAFEKGHAYRAQGRVTDLWISDDLSHVGASVHGSGGIPYKVEIQLDFGSHDRLEDVDGRCTCPVGMNCKHVAATLLAALTAGPKEAKRSTDDISVKAAPVLPPEVMDWLEGIGKAVRGNEYPADITQRLLYCVEADHGETTTPHLHVSLLSAKIVSGGELGGHITQPSAYDFIADRAPKYFRDCDIDIVVELSSRLRARSHYSEVIPARLLQAIVGTGRAIWKDYKRAPLRWGDARTGRIEWHPAGQRGVAPRLTVPGAIALNAEPPVYVDEAAGLAGPVELGLPARLAWQLLAAPAIPRAQIGELSRRLAAKLPSEHQALLPALPATAVTIDEDPVPVLRLMLGRSAPYGYYRNVPDQMPVAHLSFRYGPVQIEPSEKPNRLEAFQNGQVHIIIRRRAREKEALKPLTGLGFAPARTIYPALAGEYFYDLTFGTPQDWFDFLESGLARLEADGFEVRIEDDFPYRLAAGSPEVFDAEFQGSGIDWFELALGIEIDGERHDLAPLLSALVAVPDFTPDRIEELAQRGRPFYLPLADGRYLSLAASRFLPLIMALHDLKLSGAFARAPGKIRLSRADALSALGFETGEFAFKGAESIRHLASLVRARGLVAASLPESFHAELRSYQTQGVAWLDLLRETGLGGVLADDMGLGKTVQILALLALEKARGHLDRPALVIAPTSLMANWFSEAGKFAPDLKCLILQGADRKQNFAAIGAHDVVLSTYPLVVRDRETLLAQEWHMVVLDEAQTIKNPNAATTRLLRDIKARHCFCLTGTPVENHLGELWSIMNFVNPGYLGDKSEFARRWRAPIEKRGDKGHAAALARRVRPFLLRRTKTEVAAELPPKTEIVEHVTLEGSQRDLYDSIRLSMSKKVRKAIAERGLAKSHIIVLEALLRLRQACCDPALLKLDDRVERPSVKLDRLMEMVLELLSEGRKIIVFSQFTSMIGLIRRRLDEERIGYSVLTGDTVNCKEAIESFQSGSHDIFLVSLKAGGVGLNLTAADTVIIFDPWWNPAVEEQAIDRAHRIGQDKPVFVYRLVAAGTIEEKMDELKARKRALADGLFDKEGRPGSALTEADIMALFDA